MITYEEAFRKAKKYKFNIDLCVEYDNAYMFQTEIADDDYVIGGPDMPIIIMKADGRDVNMTTYMMREGGGKKIGQIPLPE